MRTVARIIGATVGVAAAIPVGLTTGCRIYEATGPEWAQCGYEFEGTGHVIAAVVVAAIALGFLGHWIAGRLMGPSNRD